MTAQELWGEIPNHPNYEASTLGQVRRKGAENPLKPSVNSGGYLNVALGLGQRGAQSTQKVHRLVALTFLENPEDKEMIDHINRVKTDNRLENLRWATREENMRNQPVHSNNKLKLKHIYETTTSAGQKQFRIQIKSHKITRSFNQSCWTLEQVVDVRNNLYREHDIQQVD